MQQTSRSNVNLFTGLVTRSSFRGGVANILDFNTVISEFKLHFRNYVPFQTNTIVKGVKALILPAIV